MYCILLNNTRINMTPEGRYFPDYCFVFRSGIFLDIFTFLFPHKAI